VPREPAIATLSQLTLETHGVFRIESANAAGVTANQVSGLVKACVAERVLPNTYRIVAVPRSPEQDLRAALMWAGDRASVAGRSAGARYRLEGVRPTRPEIVVPLRRRARTSFAIVYHGDPRTLMIRRVGGLPTTGVEATLLRLAHVLDTETFEIACEDARRRGLTSVPALRKYLERHAQRGRLGVSALRNALDQLDPAHPARSTLEVLTRRLLVAHGLGDFVREFPLEWNGRTYFYDFAFPEQHVILETNGRRWHDDATDYEHDQEKWSVPGRRGFRIVFATWDKVNRRAGELLDELAAAFVA
jgi:very-short-patch-repair endonuclease